MTTEDRTSVLSWMVENGDDPGLAVILDGQEIMTCITEKEANNCRAQFTRKQAADLVDERDAIKYSSNTLFSAHALDMVFSDEISDPKQNQWSKQGSQPADATDGF